MFTHVMLGANDLDESKKFYDATMGALGYDSGFVHEGFNRFTYSSEHAYLTIGLPIDKMPASSANGGTVSFAAKSTDLIDHWHAAGIANGGVACEDPPGIRERADRKYYAAYLRDPAGNKICAIKWLA